MISVLIDDSGLVVAAGHIVPVDGGHEVDGALYPSALGLVLVSADQLPDAYVNGRWRLDGGVWEAFEVQAPEPAPAPVPDAVSRAQLRLAMLDEPGEPAGPDRDTLLDWVDRTVASSGDRALQERWAAAAMERASPMLVAMAPLFGLSGADVDRIFRVAGAK